MTKAEIHSQYQQLAERAQALRTEIDRIVGHYATRSGYLYESRIKALESYVAKLQTGRFSSLDLDDVLAATIVVHRTDQIRECVDALPVAVRVEQRRDPATRRQEPDTFGFNDTIAICRLAPPAGTDAKPGAIYDARFEIQVKTILQFAWTKLTHAVAYKANEVNWRRYRLAAQMRAVTEQADLLYATFDTLVQSVPPGRSDRVDDREKVFRGASQLLSDGVVPLERKPADMVHFADACIVLCQVVGIGVEDALGELEAYLRAGGYPVALTLWEVVAGVLLTKRWGQLSLKTIRRRGFFFFVTDEAVDIFPRLREIPSGLRIGA
jgi:ppGpp synthetase/RelA/SpoT-type nucleotidyltranferase